MNLILIGFKGVGKTTLGKKIAHHFSYDFCDTDKLIEAFFEPQKMSCRDIFAFLGEKKFRTLETSVLQSLTHHKNTVIATGAGSVLQPTNRRLLQKLGTILYLKINQQALQKLPPLLVYPQGALHAYHNRMPLYESIADLTFEITPMEEEKLFKKLKTFLCLHKIFIPYK